MKCFVIWCGIKGVQSNIPGHGLTYSILFSKWIESANDDFVLKKKY